MVGWGRSDSAVIDRALSGSWPVYRVEGDGGGPRVVLWGFYAACCIVHASVYYLGSDSFYLGHGASHSLGNVTSDYHGLGGIILYFLGQ